MNQSFYSAAVGAGAQQARLNVIGNNFANINTHGFKTNNTVFSGLIYSNINAANGEVTNLRAGSGSRLEKTDTDFESGAFIETRMPFDYMIVGDGFFALYDPATEATTYTRDGGFRLSEQADGRMYLASDDGKWVLDRNNEPIVVTNERDDLPVAVFGFAVKNGIIHSGGSEFTTVAKNGEPILLNGNEEQILQRGYLENSNVSMQSEMAKVIETQRAYQYALKMIQTSDEVETTINSLRQ